jgi:hypothetical protein
MRKILIATLLAMPLLATASVNLVRNGSFEATVQGNGSWDIYSALPNWSAVPEVELRNNVSGTAHHGSNYVELDASGNGRISQSFATIVGQMYQLSFFYSNRTNTAVSTNGLDFRIGSSWLSAPVLAANNTGNNLWSQVIYNFSATGNSTTLSFRGTGTSDSYGSSLDNVSVTTAVPEPETYALFLAGLAAVIFMALRRRDPR